VIEVVQVDFDAKVITYSRLIEHFWTLHDPTSVDRQGADVGVKYRSALYFCSAQQAQLALVAKQRLDVSGQLSKPVATVILPLDEFQLADDDQQRYLEKHGASGCAI
jgi:peptide-methionine (S)-S-oxide reductase